MLRNTKTGVGVYLRLICDVFLFAAVLFLPWHYAAGGIIVFGIIFSEYWEGVAAGLMIDSFYSVAGGHFWGGFGFFTLPAVALVLLSSYFRREIRILN